jgi:heterodisulfide reductase subunit A
MASSREGVYLASCSQSPKDIPDSVSQGSAAAAKVMDVLPRPERKVIEESPELEFPEGEESRIGVFVCMCGKNIAGYLDVDAVKDYALTLPNVVAADTLMFACSQDAQGKIKKAIEDNKPTTVVAAGTPRTHERSSRTPSVR